MSHFKPGKGFIKKTNKKFPATQVGDPINLTIYHQVGRAVPDAPLWHPNCALL
jgi:hypothetical protein